MKCVAILDNGEEFESEKDYIVDEYMRHPKTSEWFTCVFRRYDEERKCLLCFFEVADEETSQRMDSQERVNKVWAMLDAELSHDQLQSLVDLTSQEIDSLMGALQYKQNSRNRRKEVKGR